MTFWHYLVSCVDYCFSLVMLGSKRNLLNFDEKFPLVCTTWVSKLIQVYVND